MRKIFMLFRIIIFIIFSITNLYAENLKNVSGIIEKIFLVLLLAKHLIPQISEIGINKNNIKKRN